MKKPNILFITNDMGDYGASKSLINLISSLENKITPYLYVTNKCGKKEKPCKTYQNPIGSALGVVDLNSKKAALLAIPRLFWRFFCNIIAIMHIYKLVRKLKIDIIHTNTSVIICGFLAAKICGIKHIWHLREFIYNDHGSYPITGFTFLKFLINKSDAVIPITNAIKSFHKTNYFHLYDAVISKENILQICDSKDDYLLFCGALAKGKQPEHAIKAFNTISKDFPTLRLKLAGTGELKSDLIKLSKELNLENRIDFLGYVQDPYILFNKAKAFLMTSKSEGMGRTTVEAMANDCVVIGFNEGGTKELIKHNQTGFLYDSMDEFIKHLKYVLEEPSNCKNIRVAAKNWALENCLEENYGEKILNIYKQALKRN